MGAEELKALKERVVSRLVASTSKGFEVFAERWLEKLRAIRDAPVEERRRRIEGGEKNEGRVKVVEMSGKGSVGGGAAGGSRRLVKNIHAKAKYYFGGSVTWGPGEGAPEGTAFEKVGSTRHAYETAVETRK